MNARAIGILAALFVILGGLYFLIEDPRGTRHPQEPAAFVPEFNDQAVVRIKIEKPDSPAVVLDRAAAGWTVSADNRTFAADSAPVTKLLENVQTLALRTVVSRNPEKFSTYEVSGENGLQVTLTAASGQILAHFFVGKSGPDIFSTYVRAADSQEVLLAGAILKNVYDRPLDDWRDRTIFDLAPASIDEYALSGDQPLQLQRSDTQTWQVVAPERFVPDQDAITAVLQQFAGLQAAGFSTDNETRTGLAAPQTTIRAHLQDGTEAVLAVGNEKNTYQHYVKTAAADQVFVLENHVLEQIIPSADKLKPALSPADNATAQPDNATAGLPAAD